MSRPGPDTEARPDATPPPGRARILRGVGAAALSPLSLITVDHPDEERRERAVPLWRGMGAVSSVFGLVPGGVLTASLSWRWVLLVNIPVGVALFIAGLLAVRPDHGAARRTRLDLP